MSRSCVLCAVADAQPLYRPVQAPGPVVRCRRCGLVYISPIEDSHALIDEGPVVKDGDTKLLASNDLGDLQGSWELPLLVEKQREWPALRLNGLDAIRRIEHYTKAPGRILDFGCGWGFFLAAARERGWETYGLEPLPGHALHARVKFGAQVVTDVLRDTTFPAGFFDVITAFQVFEHLPRPEEVIDSLRRLLKPGGIILVEVPNIDTWSVRLLGKRHRHYVQDHLTFFSARTLDRLLRAHGFEVLEDYYPTRRITLRHLARWCGRMLPGTSRLPTRALQGPWLDCVMPLNLGDIVAIIGRVPVHARHNR